MTRTNMFAGILLNFALLGGVAAADEIALDRGWDGQIRVDLFGTGALFLEKFAFVPATLESVLDDGADTFTLKSLTYSAGGVDVNQVVQYDEHVVLPPDDFPGVGVPGTLHHELTFNRVEWSNAPSYANLGPVPLQFYTDDRWSAGVNDQDPVGPVLIRVLGEYALTLGDETTVEPFDVTVEVTPNTLPGFEFAVGTDYPRTLRFEAFPNYGAAANQSIAAQVAGLSRSVDVRAAFRQVPEPGTLGLGLLAGSALLVPLARRVQRS